MALIYSTKEDYYIKPGAIIFGLNALDDYDKVAVSLTAGVVIRAFHEGIIDYNASLTYRNWVLRGTNTKFARPDKVYVYAKLSKVADTAELIFPYEKIPLDPALYGTTAEPSLGENDNENEDDNQTTAEPSLAENENDNSSLSENVDLGYYYVMLGSLTASEVDGVRVARTWDDEIEWGNRGTDKQQNEEGSDLLRKMFAWKNGVIWTQANITLEDSVRWLLFRMYSLVAPEGVHHNVTVDTITDAVSAVEVANAEIEGEEDWENWDASLVTTAAMVRYHQIWQDLFDSRYLRKDQNDRTPFNLSMRTGRVEEGLTLGKTVEDETEEVRMQTQDVRDSMTNGEGALMTNKGRLQVQNLEVRGALTVMDLIYNQLHAMAGEYYFSDAGAIDTVTPLGNNNYRVRMRREYATQILAFERGDILFSIANNLTSKSESEQGYYVHPSWMKATDVVQTSITQEQLEALGVDSIADLTTEQLRELEEGFYIDVELYNDASISIVVGSTNFPPEDGFNIVRRGNYLAMTDVTKKARARVWHLSNTEGMMAFMDYMYSPKVGDENYQTTIGRLPQVQVLKDWFRDAIGSVPQDHVGVYSQFMFAENFVEINWMGRVMSRYNNRGDWSLQQAQSQTEPYRVTKITQQISGTPQVSIWQTDTVQHLGCVWACMQSGTTQEPTWAATDWEFVSGPRDWGLAISHTIYSSMRSSQKLRIGIKVAIIFNGYDATDRVRLQGANHFTWVRYSGEGQEAADESFNRYVVPLRRQDDFYTEMIFMQNDTTKDLGDNFLNTKTCAFTISCTVPNGSGEDVTIQHTIPIV